MRLSGFLLRTAWLGGALLSSPFPRPDWTHSDPEAVRLRASAVEARGSWRLRDAVRDYRALAALARTRNDEKNLARYLANEATALLVDGEYGEAVTTFGEARRYAERAHDTETVALIAVNLLTLYKATGDVESAVRAGESVLSNFGAVLADRREAGRYAELFLQVGTAYASAGDARAAAYLLEGIDRIRTRSDEDNETKARELRCAEATAWDRLGLFQLREEGRDLAAAESALARSLLVRKASCPGDVGISLGRLGALRLTQADAAKTPDDRTRLAAAAKRLTQAAMDAQTTVASQGWAQGLRAQLGEAEDLLGEHKAAFRDLREAARMAMAGEERTGSQTAVYSGQTEASLRSVAPLVAAAARSGATGNRDDLILGFEAEESVKVLTLRNDMNLAGVWRERLKPEYWRIAARIGGEEAAAAYAKKRSPQLERDRLRLTELEAEAGRKIFFQRGDIFSSLRPLSIFQMGLRYSEVLCSFSLGNREAYVWVVTDKSINEYDLGASEPIRALARRFRDAVRTDRPEARALGAELYSALFGKLSAQESSRPDWLLSLDGELFQVPFPALRTGDAYLVERRSITILPAGLAGPTPESVAPGVAVAVGDPVYNRADPRYRAPARGWASFFEVPEASAAEPELTRLPGTGREIDAVKTAWAGEARSLDGMTADVAHVRAAVDAKPAALHFATHVFAGTKSSQTLIALGLDTAGRPTYLSTTDVGLLNTPGALVVMTGCDAAAGDLRAGAGMLGLIRAWTLAGASAIVATQWPVRDSNGETAAKFYSHLSIRSASGSGSSRAPSAALSPARALQASQVEALRGSGPESRASSWASLDLYAGAPAQAELYAGLPAQGNVQ